MAKQPLSMVRGTSMTFALSISQTDGAEYELAGDEILRFGVKRKPDDTEYLFVKEATAANVDEEGNYLFDLMPVDTEDLPFGCYYYDVGLQSGNNYFNVIEASYFKLSFNVTEWEATT